MGKITHDRPKDSSLQANRFARLQRWRAAIATSQGSDGLARPPKKRDDGHMKRGDDESEFYGAIIRRAKKVRERAAESLRLSRRRAKDNENVKAAPRSRRKD
jgi:hypothetical protein